MRNKKRVNLISPDNFLAAVCGYYLKLSCDYVISCGFLTVHFYETRRLTCCMSAVEVNIAFIQFLSELLQPLPVVSLVYWLLRLSLNMVQFHFSGIFVHSQMKTNQTSGIRRILIIYLPRQKQYHDVISIISLEFKKKGGLSAKNIR